MRSPAIRSAALLLALVLAVSGTAIAGDPPAKGSRPTGARPVDWVEYGDALERAKRENKHVLIDFYTTWCGWCKVMDRNTYGDSTVVTYLRQHFLTTKINAESPKRFKVGEGTMSGVELARKYGVSSFPITWFVKPDGTPLDKISGYFPPEKFMKVLVYVQERSYEKAGN